jgi:hypothetical protein
MTTRKTEGEKSHPAGISLPRDLIADGKAHAKLHGYGGLSGLTRHLLTTYLAEAAEGAQHASQEAKAKGKKKVGNAARKLRERRQNEE